MKKFFCIIMSVLLIMALASCGCDKSTGNTFKIGVIGPLSGSAAAYGIAVQRGAEIAVEEINAAGGVNGAMLELQLSDDQHTPEKSVHAYNALKDWGMQILMGTVTSGPCVAVSYETKRDNIFQITPTSSAAECVEGDNAFRLCFSDPAQGAKSAEYIATHDLADKIAVIYDDSDVYSTGIYEEFKKEAEADGLKIVAVETFSSDRSDFTVQLLKAKGAGAELIFMPIYYTETALILEQADNNDYNPIFFGCDGLDGVLAVEGFDEKLAEGVMLLTPFVAYADDEQTVNFVEKYRAKYGETPNQFAADAYDAIYAIKAALEKSGATYDMSASEICELMKKAMLEIEIDGLTGDNITWSADGEPEKEPKAVAIAEGDYTLIKE